MKIRIEKIEVVPTGISAASEFEHIPGRVNFHGKSLPVSYWIEGELLSPESKNITIGLPVYVRRHTRPIPNPSSCNADSRNQRRFE